MPNSKIPPNTGLLLVNLGSPSAPTTTAVRRYLREFLWDPRVVNLPRPLWWAILHGFVLTFRPRKSAKAYKKIWTGEHAPLIALTRQLGGALAQQLASQGVAVEVAMRYGRPSIADKLRHFRTQGIRQIVVLPLYPQYSSTTTASVFDALSEELLTWRVVPQSTFIADYHAHPAYIAALAQSIREFWQRHGKAQLLLLSFHGLPQKLSALGDPYEQQCHTTARLLAEQLQLADQEWRLVFQSRFGRAAWLQPYCVETLQGLPAQGIKRVDVVCPGFAVDCLETLEEIAIANREIYLQAGGEDYRYIPALNASAQHVEALLAVLRDAQPIAGRD